MADTTDLNSTVQNVRDHLRYRYHHIDTSLLSPIPAPYTQLYGGVLTEETKKRLRDYFDPEETRRDKLREVLAFISLARTDELKDILEKTSKELFFKGNHPMKKIPREEYTKKYGLINQNFLVLYTGRNYLDNIPEYEVPMLVGLLGVNVYLAGDYILDPVDLINLSNALSKILNLIDIFILGQPRTHHYTLIDTQL